MRDAIVCLISSYREGTLIRGAIRSVLPLDCPVFVFEGATSVTRPGGPKTDTGGTGAVTMYHEGEWPNEAAKRNEMLNEARRYMMDAPFWILTLDADEILLWAEYLGEWLDVLDPGYPRSNENIVPMKVTVPGVDDETKNGPVTWIVPSRLVHSSMIGRYEIGLLQVTTPDGQTAQFANYRSGMPPCFGEPHIHHRYYLRRGQRNQARGTLLEQRERKQRGQLQEETK